MSGQRRWSVLLALCLAAGCDDGTPKAPNYAELEARAREREKAELEKYDREPKHIKVQHILVAFAGASEAKPEVTRTREEAGKLARELVDRVRAGEPFAPLMKQYSTDPGPGVYPMCNSREKPNAGETSRSRMVKAFGDTAFSLKPGEVGLAEHDPAASPFGYHVIQRIE